MKITSLVVFCVAIAIANAAQAILRAQPKPAKFSNTPGCYIPEFDTVIPFNVVSYPSSRCESYLCRSNDGSTQISSCGAISASPPCTIVEGDSSKKYPDCCPTIQCPDQISK